jgi:membrane protease subunit (stomatin/prohibitin family)
LQVDIVNIKQLNKKYILSILSIIEKFIKQKGTIIVVTALKYNWDHACCVLGDKPT